MEEIRKTDRERFKEAIEYLNAHWFRFDRLEYEGIFKSMVSSKDTFVRNKAIYWAFEIGRMMEEHVKRDTDDLLECAEMGARFESDGVPQEQAYDKDLSGMRLKNLHIGRLKKKGFEFREQESKDKVILKWMEPKKEE